MPSRVFETVAVRQGGALGGSKNCIACRRGSLYRRRGGFYIMRHPEVVAAIFAMIGGMTEPEAPTGMGDCARVTAMV